MIKKVLLFIGIVVCCVPCLSHNSNAQTNSNCADSIWTVLPFPYDNMMDNHYRRIAHELNFRKHIPQTPEAYKIYRKRIVHKLKESFGWHPAKKTPLNAVITGSVDKGDYVIEKLLFESQPRLYVTANVYVPKHAEFPVPAVLCPHGHWPHAKHQPQVQSRGIGLAKLGYVALILDCYGFGERKPIGHSNSFFLFPTGITLEGLQIWDNMRAVDYIISRPDVDPLRIGISGASGGGNQTLYTAALDERLSAVVPTASMSTFEGLFFRGIGCVCETTPNILRYADLSDVASITAPRALLFNNTIQDPIFPIWAARESFVHAKSIYTMLGLGHKVHLVETYARHDYNREEREAMYTWMERFLKGKHVRYVSEPDLTPEAIDSPYLRVLPGTNQFPEPVKTLLELNWKAAQELPPVVSVSTPESWRTAKYKMKKNLIHKIFGGFPPPGVPPVKSKGKVPGSLASACINKLSNNYTFEKIVYRPEPDILIPAIYAAPENRDTPAAAVILVNSEGKLQAIKDALFARLVSENFAVLVPDLRGTGETEGFTYGSYSGEYTIVRNSIVSGRHILGERVVDVLKGVEYLMSLPEIDKSRISVIGKGAGGMVALLAGALEEHITKVVCEEIPVSYKSREGYDLPYSTFVPNILKVTDIPELAAMVSPRKLLLLNCVNGMNKTIPGYAAQKRFSITERIYRIHNTAYNFQTLDANKHNRESTIISWIK